jgi:hypothetical protein
MPIQGFTRFRKHQFGRQDVFGTPDPATRAYPFSGTPSVDLAWNDPEVDAGSIDLVAAPIRGAIDVTASLTANTVNYDDLPLMLSAFFGGGVTPTGGGTSKTWAYEPASLTVDDFDAFTYEFGDDVLTDWYQLSDGILESLEVSGPEGLGPLTASMSWRFGNARSTGSTDSPVVGSVPTAGLAVATDDAPVYLKDGALYIASSTAGLAAGQVSDALHSFTLRLTQEIDQKRFANGTQTFDVSGYGRASRTIELECTFAKTDDTVGTGSESDAWMSDVAVNRYIRMTFTSTAEAETAIPYSWTFDMPARYYTRTEGEIGGNTTVVLTARAFYDEVDLSGVFPTTVVNTLAATELQS